MKLVKNLYALSGVTAAGMSLLAFGGRAFATASGGTTTTPSGASNPSFSNNSVINPSGNSDFTTEAGVDFKGNFARIAGDVLQIILLIAGVLAVFYLVWSGIQYITSGGSPDKAKTARGGIINAIIGIIIVVAAFFIVRYAVGLGNTATNGTCTSGQVLQTDGTCK